MSKWTLFSNHGHVLVVLSRDPDARLRDVAQIVGITERAVQKIVRDLQDGGLVSVTKQGRRNRYRLHPNQPLRHTLEAHCTTGELLEMVNRRAPGMEAPEPEALPARPARVAPMATDPGSINAPAIATPSSPDLTGMSAQAGSAEPVNDARNDTAEFAVSAEKEAVEADESGEADARRPQRLSRTAADDGDQGSLF